MGATQTLMTPMTASTTTGAAGDLACRRLVDWQLQDLLSAPVPAYFRSPPSLRWAAWMPDGQSLACHTEVGTVEIKALATGEMLCCIDVRSTRGALTSADCTLLLAIDDRHWSQPDLAVRSWHVQRGVELAPWRTPLAIRQGHPANIHAIWPSPDGTWLLAARESTLYWFDRATGTLLHSLDVGDTTWLRCLVFSPDASAFAMVDGQLVSLRDAATGQLLGELWGHDSSSASLSYSPDGARLASACGLDLKIWDTRRCCVLASARMQGWPAGPVAYRPDGAVLATAEATSVCLRDGRTGELIHQIDKPAGETVSLAFSPDGTKLLAGMKDGALVVWEVGATPHLPLPAADLTGQSHEPPLAGARACHGLRPPASVRELTSAWHQMGMSMPEELWQFYRQHDGQAPDAQTPLLGERFRWYPVGELVERWWAREWLRNEPGGNRPLAGFDDPQWEEGLVRPELSNRMWIPIGADAQGNELLLDLMPGPAGRRGQLFVRQGEVARVLATSLSEAVGKVFEWLAPDGGSHASDTFDLEAELAAARHLVQRMRERDDEIFDDRYGASTPTVALSRDIRECFRRFRSRPQAQLRAAVYEARLLARKRGLDDCLNSHRRRSSSQAGEQGIDELVQIVHELAGSDEAPIRDLLPMALDACLRCNDLQALQERLERLREGAAPQAERELAWVIGRLMLRQLEWQESSAHGPAGFEAVWSRFAQSDDPQLAALAIEAANVWAGLLRAQPEHREQGCRTLREVVQRFAGCNDMPVAKQVARALAQLAEQMTQDGNLLAAADLWQRCELCTLSHDDAEIVRLGGMAGVNRSLVLCELGRFGEGSRALLGGLARSKGAQTQEFLLPIFGAVGAWAGGEVSQGDLLLVLEWIDDAVRSFEPPKPHLPNVVQLHGWFVRAVLAGRTGQRVEQRATLERLLEVHGFALFHQAHRQQELVLMAALMLRHVHLQGEGMDDWSRVAGHPRSAPDLAPEAAAECICDMLLRTVDSVLLRMPAELAASRDGFVREMGGASYKLQELVRRMDHSKLPASNPMRVRARLLQAAVSWGTGTKARDALSIVGSATEAPAAELAAWLVVADEAPSVQWHDLLVALGRCGDDAMVYCLSLGLLHRSFGGKEAKAEGATAMPFVEAALVLLHARSTPLRAPAIAAATLRKLSLP